MDGASTSKNPAANSDSAPAYYHDGGQRQHRHQHHQHELHQDMRTMMRYEQNALMIPQGWRFRPTDEELITEYLTKKILDRPLPMNTRIIELNLYDYSPMKLAEKYLLPEDPFMFFFTRREQKYANGTRPSRSAFDGYWKATSSNNKIKGNNGRIIGDKMTLVFHRGKQPRGEKTDWIMQEYTITKQKAAAKRTKVPGDKTMDWAVCKVYETRRSKNKKQKDHDHDEDETNSLAARSQAEENQDHPLLHNISPPTNNISSVSCSISNLAGQYNMISNSVHALHNGTGAHQEVKNAAQISHAQQNNSIQLVHSTNMSQQGGEFFNVFTPYDPQSSRYGFGAQSMPIYNNVSELDNQFGLDEPLPDFVFSLDEFGEVLPFGMPVRQYPVPLNYVPHIDPVTQSTEAEGKVTTGPIDDH